MFRKIFTKPLAFAEISRNIAEVLFASVFISSIFDRQSFGIAFLGLVVSIGFWFVSIFLAKE